MSDGDGNWLLVSAGGGAGAAEGKAGPRTTATLRSVRLPNRASMREERKREKPAASPSPSSRGAKLRKASSTGRLKAAQASMASPPAPPTSPLEGPLLHQGPKRGPARGRSTDVVVEAPVYVPTRHQPTTPPSATSPPQATRLSSLRSAGAGPAARADIPPRSPKPRFQVPLAAPRPPSPTLRSATDPPGPVASFTSMPGSASHNGGGEKSNPDPETLQFEMMRLQQQLHQHHIRTSESRREMDNSRREIDEVRGAVGELQAAVGGCSSQHDVDAMQRAVGQLQSAMEECSLRVGEMERASTSTQHSLSLTVQPLQDHLGALQGHQQECQEHTDYNLKQLRAQITQHRSGVEEDIHLLRQRVDELAAHQLTAPGGGAVPVPMPPAAAAALHDLRSRVEAAEHATALAAQRHAAHEDRVDEELHLLREHVAALQRDRDRHGGVAPTLPGGAASGVHYQQLLQTHNEQAAMLADLAERMEEFNAFWPKSAVLGATPAQLLTELAEAAKLQDDETAALKSRVEHVEMRTDPIPPSQVSVLSQQHQHSERELTALRHRVENLSQHVDTVLSQYQSRVTPNPALSDSHAALPVTPTVSRVQPEDPSGILDGLREWVEVAIKGMGRDLGRQIEQLGADYQEEVAALREWVEALDLKTTEIAEQVADAHLHGGRGQLGEGCEEEVAALREWVEAVDQKTAEMAQQIEDSTQNGGVQYLHASLSAMQEAVDTMSQSLRLRESEGEVTRARLDNLEAALNPERLTCLEQLCSTTERNVAALRERLEGPAQRGDITPARNAAKSPRPSTHRIDAIEGHLRDLTAQHEDVASLRAQVRVLEQTVRDRPVPDVHRPVAVLEAEVQRLRQAVEAQATDPRHTEHLLQLQDKELGMLRSQVEGVAARVDAARGPEADLLDMRARLDALEDRGRGAAGMRSKLDSLHGLLEALQVDQRDTAVTAQALRDDLQRVASRVDAAPEPSRVAAATAAAQEAQGAAEALGVKVATLEAQQETRERQVQRLAERIERAERTHEGDSSGPASAPQSLDARLQAIESRTVEMAQRSGGAGRAIEPRAEEPVPRSRPLSRQSSHVSLNSWRGDDTLNVTEIRRDLPDLQPPDRPARERGVMTPPRDGAPQMQQKHPHHPLLSPTRRGGVRNPPSDPAGNALFPGEVLSCVVVCEGSRRQETDLAMPTPHPWSFPEVLAAMLDAGLLASTSQQYLDGSTMFCLERNGARTVVENPKARGVTVLKSDRVVLVVLAGTDPAPIA